MGQNKTVDKKDSNTLYVINSVKRYLNNRHELKKAITIADTAITTLILQTIYVWEQKICINSEMEVLGQERAQTFVDFCT